MLVPQKIALSSSISIVNYLDTGHWQSRYQYHLVVSRGPKNSSITAANAPCRFLPLKSLNLCWLVAILDFAMKHGPGLHPILVVPKYPKCAHDFYWCFPNKLTLRSVRGKVSVVAFFSTASPDPQVSAKRHGQNHRQGHLSGVSSSHKDQQSGSVGALQTGNIGEPLEPPQVVMVVTQSAVPFSCFSCRSKLVPCSPGLSVG